MTLTGAQISQLLEALLSAYPRQDDLRLMVRVELDENLDAIAGGGNLRAIIFSLIEWANHTGRTVELIAGARRGNPGAVALRNTAAALGVALDAPPVDAPLAESLAEPLAEPPAAVTVAALLLREKRARLDLLMAQYTAASQQLRATLNAADRPLLEERLRQLEAEMAALQSEIDKLKLSG